MAGEIVVELVRSGGKVVVVVDRSGLIPEHMRKWMEAFENVVLHADHYNRG